MCAQAHFLADLCMRWAAVLSDSAPECDLQVCVLGAVKHMFV